MNRWRAIALILLVAGTAAFAASGPLAWIRASAPAVAPEHPAREITGAELVPLLLPLALVMAALALALLFVGPTAARILGSVGLVAGVGAGTAAWLALGNAASRAGRILGPELGYDLVIPEVEQLWAGPALATAGALVWFVGCGVIVLTAARWARRRGAALKYERRAPGLDWDRLDAGDDPTADEPQGLTGPSAASG